MDLDNNPDNQSNDITDSQISYQAAKKQKDSVYPLTYFKFIKAENGRHDFSGTIRISDWRNVRRKYYKIAYKTPNGIQKTNFYTMYDLDENEDCPGNSTGHIIEDSTLKTPYVYIAHQTGGDQPYVHVQNATKTFKVTTN